MKKKLCYSALILLTLIPLSFSIFFNITYSPFDADNVKQNIELLSSDIYSGRLAGSDGNALAGEFIRKTFQDNKLDSLNGSYKDTFKALSPVYNDTTPYLKISSKDKTLENLKYGEDFKEDMINFKNNNITFSKEDTVIINTNSIEVSTPSSNCLFYVSKNNDLSFRSSFISDFTYDMMILITTDTYNKILSSVQQELTVSLSIPFSTSEKDMFNVVGVIAGSSKNLPPLVLTAHYDHLGQDGLKNTYYGALDNASGTAFLLELQRTLKTFGTPKRDIIFVALNAEEFGLLGSKNFANNNAELLKGAEVINFDMIGSDNHPITLMQSPTFKDKESKLLSSIETISKKNKVDTNVVYADSSDHSSFNALGIDSLTFCHSDMSKIHTPSDTSTHISTSSIKSVYKVAYDKINQSAYSKTSVFFHTRVSLFLFSFILVIIILTPCVIRLKKKKKC